MVHEDVATTAEEIATMEVRGAAAIAAAAATALRTQARESDATDPAAFRAELRDAARVLHDTRPTAVSLPNALRLVLHAVSGPDTGGSPDVAEPSVSALREAVVEAADDLLADLEDAQERLGRVGGNRLRDGDTVMTHCHSTDALACVKHALDDGKELEAIVKETRPRKQGHITARQLREWDVPVTLIVDSAARRFLDDADHVLVGADAVAADGSVANKIGTAGLAVLARERGVPLTVAAQTLKLDPATLEGNPIEIERRDEREVLDAEAAADVGDVTVANPAFDVTPARFVDAIVTECGQFPAEGIGTLLRERFGDVPGEPWTA